MNTNLHLIYCLLVFTVSFIHAQHTTPIQITAGPSFEKMAVPDRFSSQLYQLSNSFQVHLEKAPSTPFKIDNNNFRIKDNALLLEVLVHQEQVEAVFEQLKNQGLKNGQQFGPVINGYWPLARLEELLTIPPIQFIRPVYRPMTNTGTVNTQGDAAQRSNLLRTQEGLSGAGITIGVLSDSYNALGGAIGGVSTGNLPGTGNPANATPVAVLLDDPFFGNIDEGRAMMELIHDVAPAADLAFHTATGGPAAFANGIINLANFGCEVIVDDIGYFNVPFFQDGVIAQAVNQVNEDGVIYLSAAGNVGRNSYEAAFVDGGQASIGNITYQIHDFAPDDALQSINLPPGSSIIMVLQWDQPAFSTTGTVGSASDLDLFLINSAGDNVVTSSSDNNLGGDPVEILQFSNTGFNTINLNILIGLFSGPLPTRMKYLIVGDVVFNEYATNSSTLFGHPNAAGGLGVGAAFWGSTPAFGVNPPILEGFSSAGGTPILFDIAGNPIPPLIRNKPDFVAPDGGNTSFFGSDIGFDQDNAPNFFGTSAAAPHAAGVAALLLEAQTNPDPNQVKNVLIQTTIDMEGPGFDFDSGAGLIDALAAFNALNQEAASLNIAVENQGRSDFSGNYTVEIYESGTTNLNSQFNLVAGVDGQLNLAGIVPDLYDIIVDRDKYLSRKTSLNLISGNNSAAFTAANDLELKAGDADDNNLVALLDFSILANTFNLAVGNPDYDDRADFDGNQIISAVDFSLLSSNFNQQGDLPGSARGIPNPIIAPIAQSSSIALALETNSQQVKIGEAITVALTLDASNEVDAFSAIINYDPTQMELVDLEWTNLFEVPIQGTWSAEKGQISLGAGNFEGTVSGDQVIAYFTFNTLQTGLAKIDFGGQVAIAVDGHRLWHETSSLAFPIQDQSDGILDLIVYPNPAHAAVQLLVSSTTLVYPTTVEIYHFDGKLQDRFTIPANHTQPYNLAKYQQGIYIIKAFNGEHCAAQKLVIR